MSHSKVRVLLSAALAEYAASKGIMVVYDNVVDNTELNDSIKSHIIPADTYTDTLSGDHKCFIGLYQMTITIKYGTGYLKAEQIMDDLQGVFPVYGRFTDSSGFVVQVLSPIKAPEGKQEGAQWVVPCYFDYRADTN